jgi:tetratricopeptide (TPR) repeat protein
LDLLVKLDPHEPKYHRFLARRIEALKGKGDDDAFKHYNEAYRLLPTFPQHLADLGRCLLARGEPKLFKEIVEKLTPQEYNGVMNNYNLAIYATCLEKVGDTEKASRLRREQIDAGSKDRAFYADEANYLLSRKRYQDALEIIGKAEARKCADNHTLAIKTKILEESGDTEQASRLRREQIDAGSGDAAFYADEAIYLLNKKLYKDALEIIGKAEARKCANNHTLAIKTKILAESGHGDEASRLRREQIDAGSNFPAFYADEAIYLMKKQKYDDARAIIEKADKRGCANEYTESIKAKLPPPSD